MAFKGILWHHRDFVKFWTGDTFTQFTGQITDLALPTIAVLTVQVTAFQLGILNALGFIAFPTLGLFVGVWMDRIRRRPVMIVVNLVEVATLATVPCGFRTRRARVVPAVRRFPDHGNVHALLRCCLPVLPPQSCQ